MTYSPAQGPPGKPWNEEGANYWGRSVVAKISGFTVDNTKVSGTNVNFSFNVTASNALYAWVSPNPPPPGTHPYNQAKITSVVLKVGGTTVYSGSGSSTPVLNDSVSKNVRYASTNFIDGSDIKLELEATVELSCFNDGGPGTYPPPYTLICPKLTVTNVAYNKGLTLATKEEFWDPPIDNSTTPPTDRPRGYWVENPQFPDGYAQASQGAMPAARSALEITAKHTILNSSNFLSETELAPLLKQTTCFFGFTHGETTNFRATQDDMLYFFGSPNEVANYVQSGRTALPFNMVVMHACETVGGSGNLSWQAPAAFQLTAAQPSLVPNKAYAGFTAVVWSLTQKNFSLSKHAEIVYQQLVSGKTILASVDAANDQAIPKVRSGSPLRMIVKGDNFAKIVNVYQNKTEIAQENRSGSWFWVKS